VLAVLNEGLSSEGRGANGAADGHFTYCTLKDDSATNWYGIELRSWIPDAIIWFEKTDGTFVMAQDMDALLPDDRTTAIAWRTVDDYQLAADQPLPAYPWRPADFPAGSRAYYMCQMSIAKDVLQEFQSILLYLPGVDPMDPEGVEGPPILAIQIDDRPTLRDPAAAVTQPELWKQAIGTFVIFDDFIFHMTATLQPLDHFLFCVQDNRDTVGVGEEVRVLLYAVDRFGNITDPGAIAVNVTHNGTAGSAAPNNGVFLNGNPAPQAGVPPNFGAGTDPPGLARLRFQDFHDEVNAVQLSIDDGAGHAGTVDITIEPAGAIDSFQLEIQRRGGGASVVDDPLRAGEAFEVIVRAIDIEGIVITTFTGDVVLSLVSGEMGTDSPSRRRGVHIKNNDADPFNANAFTHNFVAGDNGEHAFQAFNYTSGDLQFSATQGDIQGESREITVRAGEINALDVLNVLTQSPQTTGNSFNVEVRAIDDYGNLVDDFEGSVTLSLVPGHGTAAATAAGTRSGVFIGDTALVDDDTYQFVHTDGGIHSFPVTCYTAEVVRFHAAFNPPAGAAVTGDSEDVDIQGTAVDHFSFEARGADRAGVVFELTVTAEDASDNRVTDYTDTVTLDLLQGTAHAAGPPQSGVLIEIAPGNANNTHTYVASDHGSFTFRITPYTAETIQFRAHDTGGIQTDSSNIIIEGFVIDHFNIQIPAAIQRNVNFNVTVTAQDANNNAVQGFIGTVDLQVRQGAGAFAPIAGADNSHIFTAADNGVHTYNNVSITTDGANHVIRATDGNINSDTSPFNVAP
jgi:hypothetical protein